MDKQKRKIVIAGNWKMNKTADETKAVIKEMIPLVSDADCSVILCVPFINVTSALEAAKGTNIKIGVQNMHFEDKGAFTGEISANMLKAFGIEYAIIGHSERRQYFNETDVTVNKKLKKALENGIIPILCVGELLQEREQGITEEIVRLQTKIAFSDISKEDAKKVIIAYEPVWAIGTGKTATSDQADEVCGIIRNCLAKLYDENTAYGMSILYGGSMNAKNAKELLQKYHVDGGLIGGASLIAEDFSVICKAAE